MGIFESLYNVAEGNFGLITYAEARAMGISIRELDRWVKSGRLEKRSRGVYRVVRFPISEYDAYAVAVESIGPEAYLSGESVIQLLKLVPTDPERIYVTSPKRVRKVHGANLVLIRGKAGYQPTNYEGVRCQRLEDAIRECRPTVRPDRRLRAVEEGARQGYLQKAQAMALIKEIKDESST